MTTYTLENNVVRADGEYVCELIASDPQRLAAMIAALAQQPAPTVPDGWKLVPVELTPEMYNAFGYVKEVPFAIWKKVLAAPAAPVAQEPVAWQDPENLDRICSARSMREAKRAGGATMTALKPLTRQLYAAPPTAEQPECPECGGNGAGGPHEEDCSLANQPDTVAVPRELVDDAAHWLDAHGSCGSAESYIACELRALLAGGAE